MGIKDRLSGNETAALAMKQINPDVVAAFPITPSTEISQYFSSFVADGAVDSGFLAVESEHSAMSACIGAQAAGGRAMTATSANGLALMWEMLYIAASLRLPVIMTCVNRALSGPLNIHCDHSDAMGARDSGWIQLFCENNQEVYDNLIMATRIGEHPEVMLPVMVCQDGFITSHAVENIELLDDQPVKKFIGEYTPPFSLLDASKPVSVGALDLQPYYFEHKVQQAEAMKKALKVITDVSDEYAALTERKYGFFEEYRTDDADVAIIALGSTAGTVKYTVDVLRASGAKVGMIKLRVFRPFPGAELAAAVTKFKAFAVMDRAESFKAGGGPLYTDLTSALFASHNAANTSVQVTSGQVASAQVPSAQVPSVQVLNYIYGLGGRDVRESDITEVFERLLSIAGGARAGERYNYLGLKGVDSENGIQS